MRRMNSLCPLRSHRSRDEGVGQLSLCYRRYVKTTGVVEYIRPDRRRTSNGKSEE